MIPFLDLRAQVRSLHPEIQAAIIGVLESGNFILGENLKCFEGEFASYCGARYAIGVGSGTDALRLALMACGVGPGDEVITAPNTAAASAMAISSVGAKPVFVDVDSYYNMDAPQIERAITSRTRAIVPVHLYGHPADMDSILAVAQKHGLPVIEDACQAHGAAYRGRKVGSIGRFGCFSFYPTKNLGGYGDGGMIITNQSDDYEMLRQLRNLGQTDRYHHAVKGLNSRLDELQAAVLRIKLKRLDEWNHRRRALAQTYRESLPSEVKVPEEADYASHVYHLYVVRVARRDDLRQFLADQGIETLIHYPIPIHLQEAYSDLQLKPGCFPAAERAAEEIISLPLYPSLEQKDLHIVSNAISNFYRTGSKSPGGATFF